MKLSSRFAKVLPVRLSHWRIPETDGAKFRPFANDQEPVRSEQCLPPQRQYTEVVYVMSESQPPGTELPASERRASKVNRGVSGIKDSAKRPGTIICLAMLPLGILAIWIGGADLL